MDAEERKEQIANALETSLDDIDECKIQKRGILLSFMSGERYKLTVEDLNEEPEDDEEEEDEDDDDFEDDED